MLRISAAQIARLGEQSFENEMVAHLGEFSPPLVRTLGHEGVRTVIRFGVAQARAHNFTLRGPVRLYLELMFLFGSSFDTDPQYPWAAQVLQGVTTQTQMSRAQLLFDKTVEYRQAVAGPDDVHTFAALRNIRDLARRDLTLTAENFTNAMLTEISSAYPQKAAYLGSAALQDLFRASAAEARCHDLVSVRGAALLIVLMLAFGYGCTRDPLYPWIARTLNDRAIVDRDARAKRLESKALIWLDHVLAHFDVALQS